MRRECKMERAESKRAAKVRRGVRVAFRWHRVKEQKTLKKTKLTDR